MPDYHYPTHITIALSTETIDALAAAAVKAFLASAEGAHRPVYRARLPYAQEAVDILGGLPAILEGRAAVTIPEVLEALGVPPERWDRGFTTRVGAAILGLGWRKTGRRASGARERVYTPPPPVVG